MNCKKACTVSIALALAGIAVSLCLFLFEKTNGWFFATEGFSLLLILAGGIVKFVYFRCPHCRGLLPFRSSSPPPYCPNCGGKIEP